MRLNISKRHVLTTCIWLDDVRAYLRENLLDCTTLLIMYPVSKADVVKCKWSPHEMLALAISDSEEHDSDNEQCKVSCFFYNHTYL